MNKASAIQYHFRPPDQIPPGVLEQIRTLVVAGGGVVGIKYLDENLREAYLIGFAVDQGRVVGTVTHKWPDEEYRKKIEAATGLDLTDHLERGYTTVAPGYRDRDIADTLIRGLIERSAGYKIYVTIRLDNPAPLRLAEKNQMRLEGTFTHPVSGHKVGVFTNRQALRVEPEDP